MLACSQRVHAQQPVPEQLRQGSAQQVEQVHVLEAQLKLMREYDARLLGTVYWSLATVATLALILVGFGWYVNFRVYERDKASLLHELKALVRENLAKSESELQGTHRHAITKLSEELRISVERDQQSFRHDVDDKVAALKSEIDGAKCELCAVNFTLCEKEAERSAHVPDNVLLFARQMLSWALQEQNEYHVGRALDRILSAVMEGAEPNAMMIMDLDPLLRDVPAGHRMSVNAIQEALQKLRSRAATTSAKRL
jgi:hypothetical protein